MPPSRRTAPPVDPAPLLADVWRRTVPAALAEPEADIRAGVTAEFRRQLDETRTVLRRPGAGRAARTLAEYLQAVGPAVGPAGPVEPHLVDDLTGALEAALAALAEAPANRVEVVESPRGPVERRVFLEERLLVAVALGRDLSDPLVPERSVLRLCVRLLARALAESVPGRSVELRVPPHVAVQCVEGPRHTRGTAPNVVEVDPIAFLELATGRRSWDSGVRSGLVHASGERADLRPWLPLLGKADGA
jgi:hypothetical protein